MRERIVQSALECMREHGVRGTTTKLVARRAGVSEGSIYNHFANRSELVVEAFGLATRGIREHATGLSRLVGTRTVEDNLVSLMESIIGFFREIAPVVGSVIGDPELRGWFTEGKVSDLDGQPLTPLTGVNELRDYLECEHELGRLPSRQAWAACATMLIGACMQYVYLELLSPMNFTDALVDGNDPGHSYARTVVRTLFDTSRSAS